MQKRDFYLVLAGIIASSILVHCAGQIGGMSRRSQHFFVEANAVAVYQYHIDRVAKEAEKAVNNVSQVLDLRDIKPITIRIVDHGICRAKAKTREIFLPIRHVENETAAIVHEVTHLIAKHGYNRFFSEGLAIYFQERFGEDNGFPNFEGVPLDNLVRSNKEDLMHLEELAYANDIFRRVGTRKRKIAYIQVGSFINFLVEKYGEKKLRELHNSSRLDYKKVYGKDLDELEIEWKRFVLKK